MRRSRGADFTLEELFVGGALNLDQVRHLHGFGDAAERLPDPLLTSERLRHHGSLGDARAQRPRAGQSSSLRPPSDRKAGPKLAWSSAGRWKCRSWDGSGGPFVLVGGRVTSASGRNDETRRYSKGAPAESWSLGLRETRI